MEIKIYIGLLILCASQLIQVSRADWIKPPFLAPEPIAKVVEFIGYNELSQRTNIKLEEEVSEEVCIAVLNYDGIVAPVVGPLEEDKSNFVLGAKLKRNENSGKWMLYITKKQDYETEIMRDYRFTIIKSPYEYAISLNIINIDDNAPVVQAVERSCGIEENYAGPSNCTYIISDADGCVNNACIDKTVISLSSVPKEEDEHFEIITSRVDGDRYDYELSAFLNVSKSLDFETISMYMLRIQAVDNGGNVGTLTTVVEVIDMPDEPPVWTRITAAENLLEKSTKSFPVSAIDGDIQIDAEISYRIEVNTERDKEYFVVDEKTGVITINPIDRDDLKQEVFRFTIIAYETEDPDSNINATIIVIIEDINDHIPEISPADLKIEIEEEKYTTLEFDKTIAIADIDLGENAQFSVSLIDDSSYNWSSAFLIVPTTGYQHGIFTISVVNASLLDYEDEDWRTIDMQLRAVEVANNSHIGIRNINIQLINWNDELPIFDEGILTEVAVPEDVEVGFSIATMHATDRDVDDNVTHSLLAQRTLTIDCETGEIVTNQNDALDYESMPVLVLQTVATDLANHKTYATLTINVIDVNDVPPKLYMPKQVPSLEEEVKNGTEVKLRLNATDVDTDAELIFSIDWDNSRAHKSSVPVDEIFYRGHLDIRTDWPENHKRYAEGTLFVTGRIDFEAFDVMFLTISVTDLKTVHNENTTSASLTLNIEDINDNSPIFDSIEPLRVIENQITDALIGTVTAKDADGPKYNKVSYILEPVNGTESGLVYINYATGVIKVDLNKGIDAEVYEYLYYDVTATDGENNSTIPLVIYVIDENDNVPYLCDDKLNSAISIKEKSGNGTPIVTVCGKDNDRTYPFNNVSYLINVNYSTPMQFFSLGRFNGLLQVNLSDGYILDRDFGSPEFTLNLKLRDNYLVDYTTWNSNAFDTTVTVILIDINDQIPQLPDLGELAANVSENVKAGERILTVVAQDYDDPATDNTKVFYEIRKITPADEANKNVNENCEPLFRVKTRNEKAADIFSNCDLRGYYGRWILELYAQDRGTDPGPLNDIRNYTIQITDFNYYDPVIEFPTSGSTIVLKADQDLNTRLRTYDDQDLIDFEASDKDYGDSGRVTFSLSSETGDHEYFDVYPVGKNVAQLRLMKNVNVELQNWYNVTLTATDGGNAPRSVSQELPIVFISTLGPTFVENQWDVWIKENEAGLGESVIIPEAHDMLSDTGNNIVSIYYFLKQEGEDVKYFNLDKSTRKLTVVKELDRDMQEVMTLHVVATTYENGPPKNPLDAAVLTISVIVLDENDNPPIFDAKCKCYKGGVAMQDALDKVILSVKATDADLNETLTYSIIPGSMTTSDPSLEAISEPFLLDSDTGELILKFSAISNMKGYFKFDIVVHDKVDHNDTAAVKVYIVSQENRVTFTFNNSASYVKEEKMFVIDSFTSTFGYLCNIDNIKSATDSNGKVVDNVTTLLTHFISSKDDLPVESNAIVMSSSDIQTISNLKGVLLTRSLRLVDVPTGNSVSPTDVQQTVIWSLVALTIFFFICSIAIGVIYVHRTRRLSQTLDKLAITKYGSQESGLDRAGVVPTTNQFASAGSNPMWNTTKNEIDDNVSQGSGDSDLIGIEDNPDFAHVNGIPKSDEKWETAKRGSVNPVFANYNANSGDIFDWATRPNERTNNI